MSARRLCIAVILGFAPGLAAPALAAEVPQVVVIGMDGLDPDILNAKLKENELPNFKRLLKGAYMESFESEKPLRSPAVWTTVASGVHRSEHGIWDFVTRSVLWPEHLRKKHPFRLMTSKDRRNKALWNYTTHAGVSAAVVNWMVTWPAESIDGFMVAPYTSLRSRILKTYKGQIKKSSPDQTHPPKLIEQLQHLVTTPESVTDQQLKALGDFANLSSLYRKVPKLKEFHYGAKWTLANTETTTRVTAHLMKKHKPRLVMAYYDGADTLGHRFWVFQRSQSMVENRLKLVGGDPKVAGEMRRRFDAVVDGYYEVADKALGELMDAADPNAVIILLSDHGFGNFMGKAHAEMEIPYSGAHQKEGVFIIKGRGTQSLELSKPVTIYDVTPTALSLLRIPVPKDLAGKVLLDGGAPLTTVALTDTKRRTALKKATPKKPETSFEDDELERLRSLGYVQ